MKVTEFAYPFFIHENRNVSSVFVRSSIESSEITLVQGLNPRFVDKFRNQTKAWGAHHRRDLQVSRVNGQRVRVYHDMDQMIGSKASHLVSYGDEDGDRYDDVFALPYGAAAWIDNLSNLPSRNLLDDGPPRFTVALFSLESTSSLCIVVEAHEEAR